MQFNLVQLVHTHAHDVVANDLVSPGDIVVALSEIKVTFAVISLADD